MNELGITAKISIILGLSFCLIVTAHAADPESNGIENVTLKLAFQPSVPAPVRDALHSVILKTLDDVLINEPRPGGMSSLQGHGDEVALALREGLNVVLEPKGFTIIDITLDIARETLASISISPAGGVDGKPGPYCNGLMLELATDDVPEFWRDTFSQQLGKIRTSAEAAYAPYVIGLPLVLTDKGFITTAVEPYLSDTKPLLGAFGDYELKTRLELGQVSILRIMLSNPKDPVKTLRVRMSGDTVPNVALDALRDAITSRSDLVVGMPRGLVNSNLTMIGDYYAGVVEDDELAQFFQADAQVEFIYDFEDDSIIAICEVQSNIYDVSLRGYIDFGLEDTDSSEVEGRLGYFIFPDIEAMVVLNLFTNDMTLEPDVLMGWRPAEGSFLAGGYDIENRGRKFFFSQRIMGNLYAEGEIFKEDDRSLYGVLYRFHQYFSGGVYATGVGDYWFRTTFRL